MEVTSLPLLEYSTKKQKSNLPTDQRWHLSLRQSQVFLQSSHQRNHSTMLKDRTTNTFCNNLDHEIIEM